MSTIPKLCAYLAAPVAALTPDGIRANLARAKRWLWFLRENTPWSIVCPWIPLVECALDAGGSETAERQRGLDDCLVVVERMDLVVCVGGRVSSGMQLEADRARACRRLVVDLTWCGEEPSETARAALELMVRVGIDAP